MVRNIVGYGVIVLANNDISRAAALIAGPGVARVHSSQERMSLVARSAWNRSATTPAPSSIPFPPDPGSTPKRASPPGTVRVS